MNERIIQLKHSDICWSFNNTSPYLNIPVKPYWLTENVDPFPCYSHKPELVESEVARIDSLIKFPHPPVYVIMPFENLSRTNGCANANYRYSDDGKTSVPTPYILLHGKRIPIMESMTKYLVSHESSHCIIYSLESILEKDKDDKLIKEYAEIRGIPFTKEYGGLKWDKNTEEIMCNDCRILLCEAEPNFWPHPVPHPHEIQSVKDFWTEMKIRYLS